MAWYHLKPATCVGASAATNAHILRLKLLVLRSRPIYKGERCCNLRVATPRFCRMRHVAAIEKSSSHASVLVFQTSYRLSACLDTVAMETDYQARAAKRGLHAMMSIFLFIWLSPETRPQQPPPRVSHNCFLPVKCLPPWNLGLWRGLTRSVHKRVTLCYCWSQYLQHAVYWRCHIAQLFHRCQYYVKNKLIEVILIFIFVLFLWP